MDNTKKYIDELIAEQIAVKQFTKERSSLLPEYITEDYELYESGMLGVNIVFLQSKYKQEISPKQFYKIDRECAQIFSEPIVFIVDRIIPYNRRRLILHRINFIVPGTQMFLPSLLLDLGRMVAAKHPKATKFTPLAQLITLYHLQKESLNHKTTKELLDIFPSKYSTITRTLNFLSELEVITLSNEKERKVLFNGNGKQLWEKVEPFMISPIEKVVFCNEALAGNIAPISSVNALSQYTAINGSEDVMYAMDKVTLESLDVDTDKENGENRIEVWRYNPTLLAVNGVADRLSLFVAMRNSDDKRIQAALEQMINDVEWI